MQRRLAYPVRRVVQQWVDDPERRLMVAERLRAVSVRISAAELLDHVVEKAALHDMEEGHGPSVAEILDQVLKDTIDGLTTALTSNPVVTVTVRRHDHHRLDQLDEAQVNTSRRLETSPGMWRSVVEAHGARISKGDLRSVSALINWVNVQGDATGLGRGRSGKLPRQPWPKRLPWPRAGVRREQALMWPALWLSGETDLFPRPDGGDPNQRRRNRRIQGLQAQRQQVDDLMRETIERAEEADRG